MAGTKRGRLAKPVSILKLEGKFRPDRHGKGLPEPGGVPVKPEGLSPVAERLWDHVVPRLIQLKVASELDGYMLRGLVEWWVEYRELADAKSSTNNALEALAIAVNKLADAVVVGGGDPETASEVLRVIGSALEGFDRKARSRLEMAARAWKTFETIAGKFGLSAADRRQLRDCEAPEMTDPFSQFLKARGGAS